MSDAEHDAVLADLRSPDAARRGHAARRFGQLAWDDPLAALTPLVQGADPAARAAGIDALERVVDERAVPLLLAALDDPADEPRDKALLDLEKYRSPAILARLLDLARSAAPRRRATRWIARALGGYDSEEAVDALLALLAKARGPRRDVFLLEDAAQALFHRDRPRLRSTWEALADAHPEDETGELARTALARRARGAPTPASDDAELLAVVRAAWRRPADLAARLADALDHAGEAARGRAADELATLALPLARAALMRAAASDPSGWVRGRAVAALARGDGAPAPAELVDLRRADPPVDGRGAWLGEIARALSTQEDPRALDALCDLLADESAFVRVRAASALLAQNREALRETWRAHAADGGAVGEIAREALDELDAPGARR